jgi:hypothetical protein
MHRTLIIAAAAATVLFGSPTIAAAQGNFCADLKVLTAQVGDGFTSVRGPQLTSFRSPDHEYITYAATRSLADARRWEVVYIPENTS